MKNIYFKLINQYKDELELIPRRSTKKAAGYDFKAATDINIEPYENTHKVVLIPTGVKAHMPDDFYLQLANRSSNAIKRGLMNPNGIGVIDADYYNNDSTDGHIMFPVINFSNETYNVKKGDRICQGIFLQYSTVENESNNEQTERSGGFGSTD